MEKLKCTTITTERLRLRPLTLEDADAIFNMRSVREIYKWTVAGQWTSKSQATEWLTNNLSKIEHFNFAIELLSPPSDSALLSIQAASTSSSTNASAPVMIGSLGCPNPGELGYVFQPSSWGRGYATEAIKGFLKAYYDILGAGAGNLIARTDVENTGSRRVLEKVGFREVERQPWSNVTLGQREAVVYEVDFPGGESTSVAKGGN